MPRVKINLEGDNKTKFNEYTRNIGRYNRKQMTQNEELDFEILEYDVQRILHQNLDEALGYSIKDLINRKYKKYEPTIKVVMNMKYLGQSVVSLLFYKNQYSRSAFRHRQKYTFDWIEKFSNDMSTYLQQNNVRGNISTALLYPHGWKAGKMSDIGQNVVLHNPNQVYQYVNEVEIPEEFQMFNIFLFLKSNEPEGGASNFNDCFYDCLKYYIHNIEELIGTPEDLKNKLKIKRIDKIKIEHIDAIEKC